jgi:hypothetical protein
MAPAKLYDWNGVGMVFQRMREAAKIEHSKDLQFHLLVLGTLVFIHTCSHAWEQKCSYLTYCRDLTHNWKLPKTSVPQVHSVIIILSRSESRTSLCCALTFTGLDVTYLDLTTHEPIVN